MKQAAKNDGTKRQRFKRRKRRREREKASERERKRCDDIRTDSTRSLTDNGQLGRQSGSQAVRQAGRQVRQVRHVRRTVNRVS